MITSPRNRKVERAAGLKRRADRDRERAFLVEGAQAVGEALGAGAPLETVFHTDPSDALAAEAAERGAEIHRVADAVMTRLTSTVTPQGLVAVAPFLDVPLEAVGSAAGCVAVLASVRDPGNAGTVLRSADAAGAGGVIFSSASVDVYNPKAVRASAGSLFHVPFVRGVPTREAVAHLRERGFVTLATAPDADESLYETDLSGPVALLFGNEAWGLPSDVAELADRQVRIPHAGRAESLNLAAAATLALFEWMRRRPGEQIPLEAMIAAAAHDIRSPLTAMKGFGHTLSQRWRHMSDEQRDLMLQAIVYDTERLNGIVRQLVDAARIAGGGLELFPERTDVAELVRALAHSASIDPEHPPVVWEGEPCTAVVDPDRLRSVVSAFLEAEVWWASVGEIGVAARREGERLHLVVRRSGPGVTPAEAEELFRPRRLGTGSGSKIGLFVARGIAEAMGGAATVEVDHELRFRLDVPVAL